MGLNRCPQAAPLVFVHDLVAGRIVVVRGIRQAVKLDESDPNSRGDYEHPLYRLGILKGTGFYATTGLRDFVKLLDRPLSQHLKENH